MSKTPRTLLENYLDVSKTQTVKVRRNQHVGLVRTPPDEYSNQRLVRPRVSRTPEPRTHSPLMSQEQHASIQKYMSKTPEPYMRGSASKSRPQHDRVSTLRSKRRSVSNNDVEETPRQLLQGFLESEDTTAPLVRYASRTSQGRLSSSQPALPTNSGRSSMSKPDNWAYDIDSETPRTLLQKYVLNTTDVIDTPGPREDMPEQHTPDIPIQHDTYYTPSPFKGSSAGSEVVQSPRSTRGKTPRSARRKEKFQMSMMESMKQEVDESIIPPTNPADYQVPSAFRSSSSDEESFIPETQPSLHRTLHHKGQFDISIPEAMREEISQYKSLKLSRERLSETRSTESRFGGSRVSDSENEMDYEEEEGTRPSPPSHTLPGTSLLPDWEEYTMPLKGSEMDKSPVISDKGYRNSSLQEEYGEQHDRRYRDHRRMGRWSEGHQSRLQSPEGANRRSFERPRRSMPGQMTVDKYFSPRQNRERYELGQPQGYDNESASSSADAFRSERRSHLKQHTLTSEMVATLSSGQIDKLIDDLSPDRKGSYNEDSDEMYYAQKLANSPREEFNHPSLAHMSGDFSPRITSTQRYVTNDTPEDDNDILPTVTPSPVVSPSNSPRSVTPSSSTRTSASRILMPSNKDNQSTSASPSSSIRSMSSRNSSRHSMLRDPSSQQTVTPVASSSRNTTPGSSARRSRQKDLTPLQAVTPSPVVSSGASSVLESPSSQELQPSSRKSRTPGSLQRESRQLERSRSSRNTSRSSLNTSTSSQNRSRSMVPTPSKSVHASPVVASRAYADMVHTLPNNTVNFSPQIASTQNLATVSCVAQDHSKTKISAAADDDHDVDEDSDRDTGDDEQWQDEMDAGQEDINKIPSQEAMSSRSEATAPKRKKVERKPRQKSNYSMPVNLVKKSFTHYAGMRVSKEAVEEVMKVSEKYWDILARDLEAYAKHARRKQINMSDFVLLFKRQGYVTAKQSLKSLIEKYLPMEEREKLIPVARAGNRIEPKL